MGFHNLLGGVDPLGGETQLSVKQNACIVLHLNYVPWEKESKEWVLLIEKIGEAPVQVALELLSCICMSDRTAGHRERAEAARWKPQHEHSPGDAGGPRGGAESLHVSSASPGLPRPVLFSEQPREPELCIASS